jgi:hypothetical protein
MPGFIKILNSLPHVLAFFTVLLDRLFNSWAESFEKVHKNPAVITGSPSL